VRFIMKTIALIAHDRKKDEMLTFVKDHVAALRGHQLLATSHTGTIIHDNTGLDVTSYLSGPMGGDLQIAAALRPRKWMPSFFCATR